MKTRPLGTTGLTVSEVGFGTLPIAGGFYGRCDDAAAHDALREALDLGCTFFDTADVYGAGKSEQLLAEVLARRRSEVVVATKAGLGSPPPHGHSVAQLRGSFLASKERLGGGPIDLFQLHDPPDGVLRDERIHRFLTDLKADGHVRATGISVISPMDGLQALRFPCFETIQVEANLLTPEAIGTLIPEAYEKGVGVIIKMPLDHGMLSGKYHADSVFGPEDLRAHAPKEELARKAATLGRLGGLWGERSGRTPVQAALRYLLDQPGVTTIIPGIKTVAQARESMGASVCAPLTEEEIEEVRRVQGESASVGVPRRKRR